jgi:DNA-binding response OmpR family regulator
MVKKLKDKTVLIIEDDADIQTFAGRVLKLEGYHVLQAETGKEGLRLARENNVSLALLDLRLPDNSGWVILEQFKNDPELSVIPVIVFTASYGVLQRDKALAMGATDYLVKPLSAAGLKKAVARALRRKRRPLSTQNFPSSNP